jgi:hypothetical protein
MKRSNQKQVILVLAGSLAAGIVTSCADGRRKDEQINNTYATDLGYFHSQTGGYYPYPYNYYNPGMGYYGGSYGWSSSPHKLTRISAVPFSTHRSQIIRTPTPGVTPPVPRQTQMKNYNLPANRPVSTPSYNSSPTSKPVSPTVKSGGFGSSSGSAVS